MSLSVTSGPWDSSTINEWLRETVIPIRVATSGKRGPLVQSLWFVYHSGSLWCATQGDSTIAKRVKKNPVIGWEVSADTPPYRGVRGRGTVKIINDPHNAGEVLRTLIAKYGQSGTDLADWLLSRVSTEVALQIDNLEVISWDYSPRMKND